LRLFFYTAKIAVGETPLLRAHFSAGIFSEEDLARPEQIRWDPARDKREFEGPLELPAQHRSPRSFSRGAVKSFAKGRIFDCFGPGFERALTHVRTPRVATEDLFLLDEVPAFDPVGGPWGRGYLRATQVLSPDDWCFAAHFPGDPCLPGFLLVEGAFQALSFYLVGLGMSLSRDGWRFEQLRDRQYEAKFRGQVTPQSASLAYEIFVESLVAGPAPYILADVICSIDGRKIFHARRLALGLVPDWPLEQFRLGPYSETATTEVGPPSVLGGLAGYRNDGPPAFMVDGKLESDYPAMLAFAWGKSQDVLGPSVVDNDGALRWPRLPAPPYLFLTRITRVSAEATKGRPGAWVESEYQVHERSWFFNENGNETMPFAVMLEAVLQPFGWLMFYVAPVGVVLDRILRNLDGTATFYEELPRGRATLRVRAELVSESYLGGIRIYTCAIRASVEARCICELRATFGVFPPEAMIRQIGLPTSPHDHERIATPGDFHRDLTTHPSRYFAGSPRLAGDMLRGIQRVTAFEEAGGKAGLGWLRGEKDVDPDEWIFKCHFFQDPVQPGSLGLEALLQLLQFFMIERGMGDGIPGARFEPIALGKSVTWRYRGQVLPEHKLIVTEIDVSEIGRDEKGPLVIAQGWLWVDGVRVYHATDLGMRIVSSRDAAHREALR
jgi:3-hydroxymyristoyl/3-hydroxydecanoyl-(acyl carrier protein) dehydratase